jgi:hypothetical protein
MAILNSEIDGCRAAADISQAEVAIRPIPLPIVKVQRTIDNAIQLL